MPTGVTRILPFAVISAVVHAAVLVNAPQGLDIAVTPDGNAGAVSVRLTPAGPPTPEPATPSGGAGAEPHSEESARSTTADPEPVETTAQDSPTRQAVKEHQSKPQPDTERVASIDPDHATTSAPKQSEPGDPETNSDTPAQDLTEANTDTATRNADERTDSTPKAEQVEQTQETVKAASTETGGRDPGREPSESDTASGSEGDADRAQLASEAQREVEVHFRDRFRYPRIARQRGWEGRVVLGLRVQADGRISDVEVIESSGRAVLDEDARQTLIHIQRIPELGARLQSGPLELEVPVTYRLQPG